MPRFPCLSVALACACALAVSPALAAPERGFIAAPNPWQSMMLENANLSVRAYIAASRSKELEERRHAELYLLGVLDATEGTVWCDYRTFKTGTIDERVHAQLATLPAQEMERRAATVIADILHKRYPCR